MATTLCEIGFRGCKANPNVWMRAATKLNRDWYWEYILCYIDDILVISHNPKLIMKDLGDWYTLKDGSVKELDQYLGVQVKKWYISNSDEPDKPCWAMSLDVYVKQVITEVELKLKQVN